jgi:OOP family OmpA-OmpF porin
VRAIFDAHIKAFSIGANLRGVFRESARSARPPSGPVDFRYGVGAGYRVSPIFKVLAEGFGSTQFQFKRGTNGLEALAAVEIRPLDLPLIFRAGGGAGVLSGVGVPVARAIVGVTYAARSAIRTATGSTTDKDSCPTIGRTRTVRGRRRLPRGRQRRRRHPDDKDKCPLVAETVNGVDDADGCPDETPTRQGRHPRRRGQVPRGRRQRR